MPDQVGRPWPPPPPPPPADKQADEVELYCQVCNAHQWASLATIINTGNKPRHCRQAMAFCSDPPKGAIQAAMQKLLEPVDKVYRAASLLTGDLRDEEG